MPKYAAEPQDAVKAVKARGSNLRVHFKNTRETAGAIRGLTLKRARRYLEDCLAHKDAIPFRRFTGGVGRKAQAVKHKATQARYPEKSIRFLLDLLQNAESNADIQGLEADTLYVSHIQVNRAPKLRRRTYRAHGRINPFMSSPSHIELILSQKVDSVKKPEDGEAPKKVKSLKKRQAKLKSGASATGASAITE